MNPGYLIVHGEPGHACPDVPCGLPGHVAVLEVDGQDYAFTSCTLPDGTYCGYACILGRVSPSQASAIRRAARAFSSGRSGGPTLDDVARVRREARGGRTGS